MSLVEKLKLKILIKSFAWRFISAIITFLVAIAFTHDVGVSVTIGALDGIFKIFSFYLFEIIWNKISTRNYRTSVIWITGLSGAGKTTIARNLFKKLKQDGEPVMLLDGDELREIYQNNKFDKESRIEHVIDVGRIASALQKQGITPIVSIISPYQSARDECRNIAGRFTEVYLNTPIEKCEERDVKGLYAKARSGEIQQFTGIHDDAPYEPPVNPELTIDTSDKTIKECIKEITKFLKK